MKVDKTGCEVKNVNPRKEKGEDGDRLASDLSVSFSVPKDVASSIFSDKKFFDKFFDGEDTRHAQVFPIKYDKRIEDLKLVLHVDNSELSFVPMRIKNGMKMTPQMGKYVAIDATLQVYPTQRESGKLDSLAAEFIEIEFEPATADIED